MAKKRITQKSIKRGREAPDIPPPPEAVSPPIPEDALPHTPGLIADEVRVAAKRLKQGLLAGETIERRYAADDPNVVPFLEEVARGEEKLAISVLAGMLARNPRLLEHPYVFQQFRHLFTSWSVLDPGLTDRALEARIKLIKAWAQGMTLGWKVSITKPGPGHGGQTPILFPHLLERDGWIPSERADEERRNALLLVELYRDLITRLGPCCAWKSLAEQHRTHPDGFSLVVAKKALVSTFLKVFRQVTHERNAAIEEQKLTDDKVRAMVLRSFRVPKGRSPREQMAHELLATLKWGDFEGHDLIATAAVVKSTLKTLRKHGIFRV